MMSSWRGGVNSMYTSTQEIRRHTVFFSCKEVGILSTKMSSLDGIKSGHFSSIHTVNIISHINYYRIYKASFTVETTR